MKLRTSRRSFLKKSALTGVGTAFIPQFLKAFDGRDTHRNNSNKKLIIVQLSGGNDGLNTIIPHANDFYYKKRPNIAIKTNEVIKLNDSLGLHPSLAPLQELYDKGEWSIINNVGYPNPNRSHFRSADIWLSASDSNEYLSTGWIGRYLDQQQQIDPLRAIEIDDSLNLALKGAKHKGFAVGNPQQLYKQSQSKMIQALSKHHHDHHHDDNVAYLYQTLQSSVSSAAYLFEHSKIYQSSKDYPKTALGKRLKQVAEFIISGAKSQIYYVNIGGFDTHANQANTQNRLLDQYAKAIRALRDDLKAKGQWNDCLVMTFSEFGRRVAENGSKGTDHGKANNVFLMGGSIQKAGFYNDAPKLTTLDKGDLKYEIDFRSIYATVLKDWLVAQPDLILNAQFDALNII